MFLIKLEKWSRLMLLAVGVISALVLAGWQLDAEWLKRPVAGTLGMNPLTALSFVFTSLALFLLPPDQPPVAHRTANIAIGIVLVICVYRLAEIIVGLPSEIDEVLYGQKLARDMAAQ